LPPPFAMVHSFNGSISRQRVIMTGDGHPTSPEGQSALYPIINFLLWLAAEEDITRWARA